MRDLPLLIIILIFLAFLLRVDFIFYVIYVSLGIYTLSYLYTPRVLRRLELTRNYNPRAFIGESVTVTTTLENKGRWPIPWLEVREIVPLELKTNFDLSKVISLSGNNKKDLAYQIRGMKRGYYRIGPLQIEVGDFFGFREIKKSLSPDFITIYPRIFSIAELQLPSRLPFGTLASSQRLYKDPARPIGIRDYEYGDSLRHINWKSSARASKVLVKTYEPAISLETMILLNLNNAAYSKQYRRDTVEWAIVVAASISAHLIGKRQPVGIASNGVDPLLQQKANDKEVLAFDDKSGRLIFNGRGSPGSESIQTEKAHLHFIPTALKPNSGRGQLMKILEQLARIEAADTASFANWLASATTYLSWGITIITISPSADETLLRSLHRLLYSGFNPILIIIDPYADFRTINNKARLFGVRAFQAKNPESLSKWAG